MAEAGPMARGVDEKRVVEPVFEERAVAPAPTTDVVAAIVAADSGFTEEFRILRAKLRSIGEERPFSCVGIVSSAGGEGKTTVALGVALALAREAGSRVLLVEADLRRPSVERYLGLDPSPGMGEWLQGAGATVGLLRLPQGLRVLPAGKARLERPELLGGSRMAALLQAIRARFDFVVVDCPPLGPVADSVILQDLVDGFLLVVRVRRSPREAILKAVSNLKPDRIQGVVLNDYREILGTYGGYGEAYNRYRG